MSAGCETKVRVLLKARPVPAQLTDRLATPWPDGLEFYLDRQDIVPDDWLTRLMAAMARHNVPEGFTYVVEGPMRSLDGSFFDLSHDTESNRETLRRTVEFGARIGATAAVVHAIAPRDRSDDFDDEVRTETLRRSLPALRFYRDLCLTAGIIPTLENIPPVAQMREGRFMHSIIGMEPADLVYLSGQIDGIKVTVDVSHAQLYLNAVNAQPDQTRVEWRHLIEHIKRRAETSNIEQYLDALDGLVVEAHISNARGLCGEGLAYDDGDLDMDTVIARLSRMVRYLVTETIEPDASVATRMREAQRRIAKALQGGCGER